MKEKKRIYQLDNAKALLILLVVMGHFAEQGAEISDGLGKVFIFIYTFHMPAFIFLSGLTHREYGASDSFRRDRFFGLLFCGFALKFCISFVQYILFGKESFHLLSEAGIPWYLILIAVYELIVYLLRGFKKPIVLIMAILLSFFVGFDSSVGDYLVLSRIVVYLPFFLFGYYMKPEMIVNFSKKIWVKIISVILVIGYAAFCIRKFDFIYQYRTLFTGKNSFSIVKEALPNVGMDDRILVFLLAIVIGLAVISLVPNRELPFISYVGKNTLQIYFWHKIVMYILQYFITFQVIHDKLGAKGNLLYLILSVIVTIVLAIPVLKHPADDLIHLQKKE